MRKVLVAVVTLALAVMLGGAWVYSTRKAAAETTAETQLMAIARLKQEAVHSWLGDMLDYSRVVAERRLLQRALPYPGGPMSDERRDDIVASLTTLLLRRSVTAILLVDADGRMLLSVPHPVAALTAAQRDAMKQSLALDAPALGAFELSADGRPRLSVAAPVNHLVQTTQSPPHAVVLVLDPAQELYPELRYWPLPTRSGEAVLLQREGDRVLFLNDARFHAGAALTYTVPSNRTETSYAAGAAQSERIVRALNYRGAPVISAVLPIPGAPWMMATEIEQAEAMEAWRLEGFFIIALTGLLTLGVVLIGALGWSTAQRALQAESQRRLEASREELERRVAERTRQLADHVEQLEKLESLRDNLTHMIVHDMRAIVMAISCNLEMIGLDKGPRSDTARECLQDATVASDRLTEMIGSLLDVNRFEQGQMPLRKAPCDLRELIERVATTLRGLLRKRRLEVRIETADAGVDCDASLVSRVISNLVGNAVNHTPDGSEIHLTLQEAPTGLVLSVKDQGPGIPSEYHARIFEKFGQVDRRVGPRHSSGLGLTFCRLAVEAHGGQIGVESTVGEGSRFWFTLPRPLPVEQSTAPRDPNATAVR